MIEHGGQKLIHSSDLNGPIIEDYPEWIIRENPDLLVLDGPMTYMRGYLLTETTLGASDRECRENSGGDRPPTDDL